MTDILIKCECETDYKYGCEPEKRNIEELLKFGVINLDKPSGPTSHQTAAWVRNILELKKAGHAGTLDPMVTGVLVITLENSCKAIPIFMNLEKEYVAVMHVHADLPAEKIVEACRRFVGKIKQLPPVKSAVARKVREREIKDIQILEIGGKDVLFKVRCQAGTYIRKLISDVGKSLGCGAHMSELRRICVGNFLENESVRLQDVKDACWFYKNEKNEKHVRKIIIPVERAMEIANVKKIFVKDNAINKICNGAALGAGGICRLDGNINKNDLVGIFSLKNEIVAIGKALADSQQIYKSKSGIVVKTDRVLMNLGTYP